MSGRVRSCLFTLAVMILLPGPMAKADDVMNWVRSQPTLDRYFSNIEVLQMPRYCQVRLAAQEITIRKHGKVAGTPAKELDHWSRIMGAGWPSFHHYCWGIGHMMRYNSGTGSNTLDEQHKTHELRSAIGEFDYVLRSVMGYKGIKKPFPLLSELYMNRSTANRILGNLPEADQDFKRALAAKQGMVQSSVR